MEEIGTMLAGFLLVIVLGILSYLFIEHILIFIIIAIILIIILVNKK